MDTSELNRFIIPLIISNVIGLLLLLTCWKIPRMGRLLMLVLFIWAGITNWHFSTNSPQVYLDYANFAFIPFYQHFINGWFSRHILLTVGFIATAQLLIGVSMAFKGTFFKLGAFGGMIFMAAIIPLGIGAGFPFPVIGALAFYLLFRHSCDYHLFPSVKKYQYEQSANPRKNT